MVAFAFNTNGITPQFGGGGGLPVGKHPVVIIATKLAATNNNAGGKLVLTLEVIDGPAKGSKGDETLVLQHQNPTVVRIASEQLAAICHVCGIPNGFGDTDELKGKPFVVEVAPQKEKPQYTEVIGVFDMNGNEPGQQGNNAGNGSFGGAAGGNGFGGGQQNANGGGVQQNTGFGAQQPDQGQQNGAQQGGGASWGGAGGGAAQQGAGGGGWGSGTAAAGAGGAGGWGSR